MFWIDKNVYIYFAIIDSATVRKSIINRRDYTEKENTMSQQSLLALIRKTVAGDIEAFEQLILSQMNTINWKIYSRIKNPDDVEDISQKVVIRIYQNIQSLKYPEAFGVWLNKVIARECIRHFSKQGPVASFEDIPGSEVLEETDTDCIPTTYMEHLELHKQIKNALERIPEVYRHMVILYYEKEMGYREIADHLGLAIGTVSANLFRAKSKLREELTRRYWFVWKNLARVNEHT